VLQRDWLMRLLQEMLEAVAAAASKREKGDLAGASRDLDVAWSRLSAMPRRMLDALDVLSLARVLGAREKVEVGVRLLEEEAALLEAKGKPADAEARRRRALALAGAVDG